MYFMVTLLDTIYCTIILICIYRSQSVIVSTYKKLSVVINPRKEPKRCRALFPNQTISLSKHCLTLLLYVTTKQYAWWVEERAGRAPMSFRYDFQKNAPMLTTTMAICPHVYNIKIDIRQSTVSNLERQPRILLRRQYSIYIFFLASVWKKKIHHLCLFFVIILLCITTFRKWFLLCVCLSYWH